MLYSPTGFYPLRETATDIATVLDATTGVLVTVPIILPSAWMQLVGIIVQIITGCYQCVSVW